MSDPRIIRALAAGFAAAAAFLVLNVPALARDDVPEDVRKLENPVTLEDGELRYYQRQYKGKCKRCHGADGTGRGDEAGRTGVLPANFTDAEYMASRTDGELYYQILMGGGKRCAMPAFGPESDHGWSEEKVWHMVAFVRRFAQPLPE